MSDKSIVEQMICSSDFSYLQPYFYRHPYALRCELGVGEDQYMENAKRRAMEIYHILFPAGADAIIFNHWIYDYCDSGDADYSDYGPEDINDLVQNILDNEVEKLRFLLSCQRKYRHLSVKDLETYDGPDDVDFDRQRRNRIVCYSDGIGFDFENLIAREVEVVNGHEVSFVSFENECIFSVYDDRGCDIVFMTHDKLKAFYSKLQPYFLEYDVEEMQKRFLG